MSNEVRLSSFPSNKTEALTMLYLQNQDLTGYSPEELVSKYLDTYKRIHQQVILERPAAKVVNVKGI